MAQAAECHLGESFANLVYNTVSMGSWALDFKEHSTSAGNSLDISGFDLLNWLLPAYLRWS